MIGNNRYIDLDNINVYNNLMKFHSFVLKILSGNGILGSIKDHYSVKNLRKLTRNNLNLKIVNINACTKNVKIKSMCYQVKRGNKIVKTNSDINQGT